MSWFKSMAPDISIVMGDSLKDCLNEGGRAERLYAENRELRSKLFILESEKRLAEEAAALEPFPGPSMGCPKCGFTVTTPEYHLAVAPSACVGGGWNQPTWRGGSVEHLSWSCPCGHHIANTKTLDAARS